MSMENFRSYAVKKTFKIELTLPMCRALETIGRKNSFLPPAYDPQEIALQRRGFIEYKSRSGQSFVRLTDLGTGMLRLVHASGITESTHYVPE